MEIEIKEIGMIDGQKDYQCFCPKCNLEARGYNPKLLEGSMKAHLFDSHKIK